MVLKVGTSQSHAHYAQKNGSNAKNDTLKGITLPKNESLEYLMFNNKLMNKICPDIYDVNSRAVVKGIQGIKPVQQTTGCGGG